jgi:5-methylcytosine-specific restriction endonuclease McrA
VKLAVWKRDGGRCIQCGSSDNLHFDHVIPYSLGGSSLRAENIQLLCARHNLQKHDAIV